MHPHPAGPEATYPIEPQADPASEVEEATRRTGEWTQALELAAR